MPSPYLDPRGSELHWRRDPKTGKVIAERVDPRRAELDALAETYAGLRAPSAKGETMSNSSRPEVGSRVRFTRTKHGIPVGTEGLLIDDDRSGVPFHVRPDVPYSRSHGNVWVGPGDIEVIAAVPDSDRNGGRVPVGSKVKLRVAKHGFPAGAPGEVAYDDGGISQPYKVRFANNNVYWLDRVDFTVTSAIQPLALGTQVRTLVGRTGIPKGSIGLLEADDKSETPYRVAFKHLSDYDWYKYDQIEPADSAPSTAPSRDFQENDFVVVTTNRKGTKYVNVVGQIDEIIEDEHDSEPISVTFPNGDFEWMSPRDIKFFEGTRDLKAGDTVEVLIAKPGVPSRAVGIVQEVRDTELRPIKVKFIPDLNRTFSAAEIRKVDPNRHPQPEKTEAKVEVIDAAHGFKTGERVETLAPKQAVPTGTLGRVMRFEGSTGTAILVGFPQGVARHYTPTQLRLNPEHTPASAVEEENTPMATTTKRSFLNLEFGANNDPDLVLTLDGKIAVKRGEDTYATYAGGDLIETLGELTIEAKGLIFNMPATKDQLEEGDLIKDGSRYLFVKEVTAEGIKTVGASATNVNLTNVQNVLGLNFYTKVVTFTNLNSVGGAQMGGFNPMMLLALGDKGGLGGDNDMFKLMALSGMMGGQAGANPMGNPMMMMLMLGGKGGDNDLMKIMALSGMMAQPQAPKANGKK